MTARDRLPSATLACVVAVLKNWRDRSPEPQGMVYCGAVGIRLRRDHYATVAADVVYVSSEGVAGQPQREKLVEGTPALVVKVLNPKETYGEINRTIDCFLSAGVPFTWIIDPYDRTLVVYSPNANPVLFNPSDQIIAEPHLPGFRTPVARLFD